MKKKEKVSQYVVYPHQPPILTSTFFEYNSWLSNQEYVEKLMAKRSILWLIQIKLNQWLPLFSNSSQRTSNNDTPFFCTILTVATSKSQQLFFRGRELFMAANKRKISQIQKDANKLLVDAEKSIQKQATDALKGIRKLILSLAKQTEQLEKKLEGKKKAPAKKKRTAKKATAKKKPAAKKAKARKKRSTRK
jgi:hypothetical protein